MSDHSPSAQKRTPVDGAIPRWQKPLYQRGILQAALEMQWAADKRGWRIPLFDHRGHIIAWRWKNYDRHAKPKSLWKEGNPEIAPYYFHPDLVRALEASGGVLYMVEGEPDLLTFLENGIYYVISLSSGTGALPSSFAQDMLSLGVKRLIQICDNDQAGLRSGAEVRKLLEGSEITHEARVLGTKDPNDLWQLLSFNHAEFMARLHEAQTPDLPDIDLRPIQQEIERQTRDITYNGINWDDEYTNWQKEIIEVLDRKFPLRTKRFRNCPNPHHTDKHPSFRIGQKGVPICTCNIHRERDPYGKLAEWLGVRGWNDFKAQKLGFDSWFAFEEYRRQRDEERQHQMIDAAASIDEQIAALLAIEPLFPSPFLPINAPVGQQIIAAAQQHNYRYATDGSSVMIGNKRHTIRKLCKAWGIDFEACGGLYVPPDVELVPADETVHTRYANERLRIPVGKASMLISGMGTGKSHLFYDSVNEVLKEKPDARILIVAHRVPLAYSHGESADKQGVHFFNYDDEGRLGFELAGFERLIITPNSLHKLINEKTGELPKYDFLFIDESEGICEHLLGATLKEDNKALVALNIMGDLIRHTPTVLFADANASWLTYNFIERHRQQQPYVMRNTYQLRKKKMLLWSGSDLPLKAELVNDLRASTKPILIAIDSRNKAKDLHTYLTQLGFTGQVVHGDNSNSPEMIKLMARMVREKEIEGQYLIFTSSMGVGVDIQADVDVIYGFFYNQSVSVEDQFQMLGRARRAQTAKCFVAYCNRFSDNNKHTIREQLMTRYRKNLIIRIKLGKADNQWENGKIILSESQQKFLSLWVDYEHKRRIYAATPYEWFWRFAHQLYEEVAFQHPDEASHEETRRHVAEIRQGRRLQELSDILTASPISADVWQKAQRTNTVTAELRAGYVKGQIMEGYGVAAEEVTPALVKEWEQGGLGKLRWFIDLQHNVETIADKDWQDDKSDTPLPIRAFYLNWWILISALLNSVFGECLHTQEIPDEEFQELLKKFDRLYTKHEAHILLNRRSSSSEQPLARLRWVLNLLGLKLVQRRHGKYKDNHAWQICPKSFEKMTHDANRYLTSKGDTRSIAADGYRLQGDKYLLLFNGSIQGAVQEVTKNCIRDSKESLNQARVTA